MRKRLQKILPDANTIKNYRWLKPFAHLLHHPNLWHVHRRSVAAGVAIGLFCGLIPGPLQMLAAAFLAVWLRVNLPVALFTTLYTNPFTILPLYAIAYELGAWLSDTPHSALLSLPQWHSQGWFAEVWSWFSALGTPILIGLPLLAVLLAMSGYALVMLAWRVMVMLRWRARKRTR